MAIEIPNLDDRSFVDLVDEAITILQHSAPEWTNHNPSDPGITVIELLAYVTEILIFRLNQITDESRAGFLQLLRGPDWDAREAQTRTVLDELIQETILELHQPQRAVTADDFVALAIRASQEYLGTVKCARAYCAINKDLSNEIASDSDIERPGHVSVSVLPYTELEASELAAMVAAICQELRPKCLLTTRLHIIGPCILRLSLSAVLHVRTGAHFGDVEKEASITLADHFNPYMGYGPNRQGWPFGRPVYLSEIIDVLEKVAGVDYVDQVRILQVAMDEVQLRTRQSVIGLEIGRALLGESTRLGVARQVGRDRLVRTASGRMVGVALRPHEVVQLRKEDVQLSTV